MQFFWRLAPLSLAVAMAGCGGSDPQVFETMMREVDSNVQCEPPRITPVQLDAELAAANIPVRAAACAWDGLGSVAACGTPVPYFRIIEIPQELVAAASTLGYRKPSEFGAVFPFQCSSPSQ